MKEIKYTKEGKKVKVIGKLNSNKIIVREIYVDGETEIPAGEDFIVTALLDKPLMTWKERELKNIEDKYDRLKHQYENKVVSLKKEYEDIIIKMVEKNRFIRNYIKSEETKKVFDFVEDILTGKIKYMVSSYISEMKVMEYDEFVANYGGIKLLTILGCDKGNLKTRINYYSDGSGGNKEFTFFKTKEDAVDFIKNKIESIDYVNAISLAVIEMAEKYGAKIDPKLIKEWRYKKIKHLKAQKQKYEESVDSHKEQIDIISKLNL